MYTAGIDVGSTYTKAVIFAEGRIVGREMVRTGFRLADAALNAYCHALLQAELGEQHMKYLMCNF